MTRFLDGPAVGQVLMLRRAPHFLRVVHAPGASGGAWDALDQLVDQPEPHERLYLYELRSVPYAVHINRSRRDGGCAWFRAAEYGVVDPQPADAVLREQAAFRQWALARFPVKDPAADA